MLVFYRSDRAKTVIIEGFQDEMLIEGDGSAAVGCLFSIDPFDESIHAKGCTILFLELSPVIFNQYACPPVKQSARTALLPARVANQYGPPKLLTYKSAVLLSRLIKVKQRFSNYAELVPNLSSLTRDLSSGAGDHEVHESSSPSSITVS
jgi:hypothetical protein